MAERGPGARAVARRAARQAKAERDAARLERETMIEAALTDYYQATAQAEQIRAAARRKADGHIAEAERAAAVPVAAARDAVQRLRDLLGGNAEVAALCGISAAAVREILAAGRDTALARTGNREGQMDEDAQPGEHTPGPGRPVIGGELHDG
jgi:hypothetical protein